ncbi:MAG: hypothetical protein ACT4N4_16820 [Rhodospirillales bacterium]
MPSNPAIASEPDQKPWRRLFKILAGTASGAGFALYALLVVVDGYDTLWFSPRFDREPVTSNQRFSFPALARKARFDSAIVGTSTARLLQPRMLNPIFGARFVNLSMNDATAWEEAQIFAVFRRHHPAPRAVIFGIDAVWCQAGDDYRKLTPRPFPEWMYDANPWNDLLHLFNLPALEETARQAAYLTGLRKPKYGKDGYTSFLPPDSAYDLARARFHLYGPGGPRPVVSVTPPLALSQAEASAIRFPTHGLLDGMLSGLPDATLKILVVMPYHFNNQPGPGSREAAVWAECKRRLAAMAGSRRNAHVVDFMIESDITRRDGNYWDPLHYTQAVAATLTQAIGDAVRERRDRQGLYRYFGPSP